VETPGRSKSPGRQRGKFKDRTRRSEDVILVKCDTYLMDEYERCI
jgi:hypothetical protein